MSDELAEKIYSLILTDVLRSEASSSISDDDARFFAKQALRLADAFHAESEKHNAPHCF